MTENLAPGGRFESLLAAQRAYVLYCRLMGCTGGAVRPTLWAFLDSRSRATAYTYTLTEAEYQSYRKRSDVMCLDSLAVKG